MRYHYYLMLCCLLLGANAASAQKDYQPGTIVKLNGERQSGWIDYRNWDKSPRSIGFKSQGGQVSELTYQELASFEVTRKDKKIEHYRRAIVQLNVSPTALDKLDDNPVPKFKTDTLMLLVLMDGSLDLFYHKDKGNNPHFFYAISDGKEVVELVKKVYIPVNTRKLVTNNQYRIQLNKLTPDCPDKDAPKIGKLDYEMGQMIEAFKAINLCMGDKPTYIFEPERSRSGFYLNAGLSISKIDLSSDRVILDKANFETDFSLTGGLGYQWLLPRTHGKLWIAHELYISHFKATGLFTTPFANLGIDHFTTKMEAWRLNLNTSVQWRFYKGKFSTFLRVGGYAGYLLNSKQSGVLETYYFDGHVTNYGNYTPINEIRKIDQGFLLGLGTLLMNERLSIEARLPLSSGFSEDYTVVAKMKLLSILAGYNF